jgi:hypothetical protein
MSELALPIDRVVAQTEAGWLLGGLVWRAAHQGQHRMRHLFKARALQGGATHYALLEAHAHVMYGLYQPHAIEELTHLPKGAHSAAHCFAQLVGATAPNAALLLQVPSSEERRESRIYVVVLEDGVPVVDALSSEMEARNALGSEERPIWSDSPAMYPGATLADAAWLASGITKAARVLTIPADPLPMLVLTLCALIAGGSWWWIDRAQKIKAREAAQAALLAADPVPKYLAALQQQSPLMASERTDIVAMAQKIFEVPVAVPGWSLTSALCHARHHLCVKQWSRKGGTFDDLRRALPDEVLVPGAGLDLSQLDGLPGGLPPATSAAAAAKPISYLDTAQTQRKFAVRRLNWLTDPVAMALLETDPAQSEAAQPQWQTWRTAGLSIDLKPVRIWPKPLGVPDSFQHPQLLYRGEFTVADVPGPFVIEALQSAPAWVSWEIVQAQLNEGDMRSRLKFTLKGNYYAKFKKSPKP